MLSLSTLSIYYYVLLSATAHTALYILGSGLLRILMKIVALRVEAFSGVFFAFFRVIWYNATIKMSKVCCLL
jgi:hypothetical protein